MTVFSTEIHRPWKTESSGVRLEQGKGGGRLHKVLYISQLKVIPLKTDERPGLVSGPVRLPLSAPTYGIIYRPCGQRKYAGGLL
jgi:hypothetical protein